MGKNKEELDHGVFEEAQLVFSFSGRLDSTCISEQSQSVSWRYGFRFEITFGTRPATSEL